MVRAAPATLFILLFCLSTATGLAQMEEVKLTLDWEPRDCGRVYAEPPGEDYTYMAGQMVQIHAEAYSGCRFSSWQSNLAGLNGTITNPVTITLFSDAYFKALFVRIGVDGVEDGKPPKTHAFLKVTANVTRYEEEVRLVPIGEEVMVSTPREIYLNESARYIFVGWEGHDSKEPTLRVLVTEDTTVKALYTLYMRFMDLWYHYSEFTTVHAPVVEVGLKPGERLKPTHLILKPMNVTLPVGAMIPREFTDRVEVEYAREYLLTVKSLAPETIPVQVSGEILSLESYIEVWLLEGSEAYVDVLVSETERGWITGPRSFHFIMDGPRSILVEYEEKPYSWAVDSPLKPLIYPVLEYTARSFRDTGMWPQISQMMSEPSIVYAMFIAFPASIAGAGYAGYRLIQKVSTSVGRERGGRARRIIEERIKKAGAEEIVSAVSTTSLPIREVGGREEIKLPENAPFPEWLYIGGLEEHTRAEAEPVGYGEPVEHRMIEDVERPEEDFIRKIDPLEEILMREKLRVDDLIEILLNRLDAEVFEELKNAVLSGRLKVTTLRDTVWSPLKTRKISAALSEKSAIALAGGDPYTRRKAAEWAGFLEGESAKKPYKVFENASEKDVDEAAEMIGEAYCIILGEDVGREAVRAYSYAARLLGRKLIKLGEGYGLPKITVKPASERELSAYMVAKAAYTGLIDRLSLEEVLRVSRIAYRTRSYYTVDDYLEALGKGPVDIEAFKRAESGKMFNRLEQRAVEMWKKTGRISDAIIHYSNLLSQHEPASMESKLRLFKEKLLKMTGGVGDES